MEYNDRACELYNLVQDWAAQILKLEMVILGRMGKDALDNDIPIYISPEQRKMYFANLESLKSKIDQYWQEVSDNISTPIIADKAVNHDWLQKSIADTLKSKEVPQPSVDENDPNLSHNILTIKE